MTDYKVTKSNILYDGSIYNIGSIISLDDQTAKRLKRFIEPFNVTKEEKQDEVVNYESYTIAELRKIIEERNIDVEPTGKNGSAIKSDYIRALEQAN